MRTFITIALPDTVRRLLEEQQRRLERALQDAQLVNVVRWTATQNLHLTLRFLGETSAEQRDAVDSGLTALLQAQPSFALALHQLGCFPTWRRPNIVWIDFSGAITSLGRLQHQVEQAVTSAGFPAEDRPFAPHLTIGRVRKDAGTHERQQLGEVLQREQARSASLLTTQTAQFTVAEVPFMQSDLRPSGPVYTLLASYSLKG